MKEKRNKNFYVYKVTHTETGQFYIGSRSCFCHPEDDKSYLGSQVTWKISYRDKLKYLEKVIIKQGFSSMTDTVIYEADQIKKYIDDPLNENYYIPGKGFHVQGKVNVRDADGKCMTVNIDDPRYLSGELTYIRRNTARVIDMNGVTLYIQKTDPRFINGELMSIYRDKKIPIRNQHGQIIMAYRNDARYRNEKCKCLEEIVVRDPDGELLSVPKNDPRYLSGEFINARGYKIRAYDKSGNELTVYRNDKRLLSNELVRKI